MTLLGHLISTFAPAASIFFLISSASSFVTPSLIVLGAPSTSALASARPSPGTAPRTSLITAILFEPISFKITSHVVFPFPRTCRPAGCARCDRTSRHRHRGRCAYTPLFFQLLDQPGNLQHRQAAELLHQFICFCHFYFLQLPLPKAFGKLRPIATDPDSFC